MDSFDQLLPVRALFAGYPGSYWVAGGWALDLFAGRVRRPHSDVDVLVLARELDEVAATFTNPRPMVQHPETDTRRPWEPGEQLTPGPDALIFPDDANPCQILLAASEVDEWVFHRGRGTIRKPLTEVTLTSPDGTPYLAPEIVLLFKSRGGRPKDNEDFADVASLLNADRRQWLRERIAPDHPWIPALH